MRAKLNPKTLLKRSYDGGARALLRPVLAREAGRQRGEINEGAVQYPIALATLLERHARDVIDVGTGLSAWPKLLSDCGFRVTAVDEFFHYWGSRPFNRHFLVRHEDITSPRMPQRFDALTCLNVMMAIENDSAAIGGMVELVRPGGTIVLSFPYNETHAVQNVYALSGSSYGHDYRFACRIYTRSDIDRWLESFPLTLDAQRLFEMFTGELWTFGHRIRPRPVDPSEPHHFTTLVLSRQPV